jgi:eukaryotic-like serine/threonine-protein kinase
MSQATIAPPKLADMQYRIVKPLGTGAGSSIFQISDAKKGGYYALKVVKRQSPEDDVYIAQALVEAEVAPKLNHKGLAKIYDSRIKKAWFKISTVELLMEFVDGRTLDDLEIRERGQLLLIFLNVTSALAHMHRRGVYHGDLKPGNIMLTKAGEVKIIDFGTAWIKGEAKNRVQGTPQYMAPEQAKDKVVDEKTDIYNLGATMYRMFTGHHANTGGVPGENGELGPRSKVKPPSKLDPMIPGTLNELLLACLQNNPSARPANVPEVHHKLAAVAKYMSLKPEDLKGVEDAEVV